MRPRAWAGRWLLAAAFFWALAAAPAAGQSLQDTGQELRQRLAQALEQRQEIDQALEKAQQELARLDQEIPAGEAQMGELKSQEHAVAARLPEVSEQLKALEPKVTQLQARFNRHLRALYLFGPDLSLSLWASAQDFHDVFTRAQALAWLLDSEQKSYREMVDQTARLRDLQAILAFRQNELMELRRQQKEQQEHLVELKRARLDAAELLSARQKGLNDNVAVLQEAETRLARTFALGQPGGQPTGVLLARGRLSPPVEGQVVGRAGPGQRGVLLQARAGAPVRAPWSGAVVHAAALAGFGNVVVLDHGQRVHTVLAHLGALSVELGQELKAGQVVGVLEEDGLLYLEVRQGTRPENPLDWLRLTP